MNLHLNSNYPFFFFQLINVGEDALVFYNDKVSFNMFVNLMKAERHLLANRRSGIINYHIELVRLLSLVTYGKNVDIQLLCLIFAEF